MDFEKEEVKLPYKHLLFEVTRKCNLTCKHCMRGEQQDVTMSEQIIDAVIPQILSAEHIALTGGEPMLVPDTINYLVNSIIKNEIPLAHFSSVVNGTILDERAIKTIEAFNKIGEYIYTSVYRRAYNYVNKEFSEFEKMDDHKFANIAISVDDFHKNDIEKALYFYKKYANKYVNIETQNDWNVEVNDGNSIPLMEYRNSELDWVRNTGRAKDTGIGFLETECEYNGVNCCNLCHRIHVGDGVVQCSMEITANGHLCFGDSISYEYEDNDKYYMCDVLQEPLSCAILKWQWKEPLLCKELDLMLKAETLIKHSDKLNKDSNSEFWKLVKESLMLKRECLKRAHEMYPNLPYEDIVMGVNAELNIHTEGKFTEILSLVLPEYYDKNYVYNRAKEQDICDRLMYGKGYDIVKTWRLLFG